MKTLFNIPANFHEFGPSYMSDYDVALFDRMVAKRLPDEVEWEDDELLIDDDSELDEEDFSLTWYDATDAAWSEFCRVTGSDADWLEAAAEYELDLPEGYNPGWDDGTHDDRCADEEE